MNTAPRIDGIRFLRDTKFPRFSMKAGEVWPHGFDPERGLGRTAREYLSAIGCGADRFQFAGGGLCLVVDVEPVYQTDEDIELEREITATVASSATVA